MKQVQGEPKRCSKYLVAWLLLLFQRSCRIKKFFGGPDRTFNNIRTRNLLINEFYDVRKRPTTDFEGLKLRNARAGRIAISWHSSEPAWPTSHGQLSLSWLRLRQSKQASHQERCFVMLRTERAKV